MINITCFNILSREKIQKIHEASCNILKKVGVKIDSDEIKDLLDANGATVQGNRVKITSDMIDKALACTPGKLTLFDLNGNPAIEIKDDSKYFGTHADMLQIIDPFSGKIRKFKSEDTKLMTKVANSLDNIDFILAVGLAGDIPEKVQSQVALIDTLKNFRKPVNFSSNDVQGLKDQIEILNITAGGMDNFRAKPFAFYYCEPIPPLYHPEESTEKLRLVAEEKIPTVYMPYCMLGATAPITFSAALAQCNAEVLSGLVITQLINEGAPFIYGAMPSIFDMKTTIGSYGAPEFHMLVAAASEIASFYNLPFYGTSGSTDAKNIDEQAIMESTMSCFSSLLSKANIIHDVGIMDHCNSVSPEMVVLFDEMIDMLSVFNRDIAVTEDDLAINVIRDVGPGGQYLTHRHTNEHFKTIWYPQFLSRAMEGRDKSEIRDKIREKIKNILSEPSPEILEKERVKELNKIKQKLIL